ncbi:zinc-finger homeodomain protein 8-like [Cornus florida]|uniref:zinc-finger homeodomain protein 8-like n=1 Tax=Cornus florida TaxID=4283 RepID=UPI00289C6807|nr:zinc-finger homeodomain protein 8-like [Cornus florida]
MRNHAAAISSHANDDCGEFMSSSVDPLTAHLNGGGLFGDVDLHDHHDHEVDRQSETPEREEVVDGVRLAWAMSSAAATVRNKRFRTKFAQQQKERMLEFAEKLGWMTQRQDDVALNQFCSEIGLNIFWFICYVVASFIT